MYNVSVSVQFQADTKEEVNSIIKGWNLADGAIVFVSSSEMLANGVVTNGEITPPDQLVADEVATAEEETAT